MTKIRRLSKTGKTADASKVGGVGEMCGAGKARGSRGLRGLGKSRGAGRAAGVALLTAALLGVVTSDAASQTTGASGSRALEVVAKDAGKCGALLVGVDEYETLTPLEYASSDMRKLRDALVEIGFPSDSIRMFVSDGRIRERPSREKILKALDEMLAASGPDSTVFIALSGHGFETEDGDAAFCPEDVEAWKDGERNVVSAETVILIEDVARRLKKDDAKFKLLIVDACREPASTERSATGKARSFSPIAEPNGVAFLQSCDTQQLSWEHPELGGGVFSAFFAEGLRGAADSDGDGGVSFLDVCNYAMSRTQSFVREKRDASQTPFYRFTGVRDFWLKPPTRTIGGPTPELPEDYLSAAGIEFRLIKPGSFMMGNTLTPEEIHAKYPGGKLEWYQDAPRHKVTLTEPFYMAKYETTVGDFKRFVDATGYKTTAEEKGNARGLKEDGTWGDIDGLNWRNPGFEQDSTHPVVCVSWDDAKAYVDWLNDNAEYSSELGFKPVYRLPSEAEWEYACRAGSKTEFFWGSNEPSDGEGYLNAADESGSPNGNKWSTYFPFNDGYVATSPVGKFKKNAWGLYDMLGNALEWCADWYAADYYKTLKSAQNPINVTLGSNRVLRGGSWGSYAGSCRSAYRRNFAPTSRDSLYGFRLVLGRSSSSSK